MMRRVSAFVSVACVPLARTMTVYTEQSPVLKANAQSNGFTSLTWLEEWEVPRHGLVLNAGATPTSLVLDKQLELFNLDQVVSNAVTSDLVDMPRHTSFTTRKPYGDRLQFEMTDRANKHGFQSKYWITRAQMNKEGMQLASNTARPSIFLTKSQLRLLNLDQFVNGATFKHFPVSGGSRKPYMKGGAAYAALLAHAQANDFRTGLYFTRRQLEALGLAVKPDEAANAASYEVQQSSSFGFYNIEQLESPQAALEALGRSPVATPTFLISGEAIKSANILAKAGQFASNYWLSGRDAQMYGWAIKPGQEDKSVAMSLNATPDVQLYNADQLAEPESGFAKAGLMTQ